MFKKILFIMIMTASSSLALASTPYIGGSLGVVDRGGIGKLFGGYGSYFGVNENIYLGGELNVDFAHYANTAGVTYGPGASFLPGIMITKYSMIYARIGLEINHNAHSSIIYFGNQLGLGLQTSFAKNWDIRGEYVRYSNVNGNTAGNNQFNLGLVYKFD